MRYLVDTDAKVITSIGPRTLDEIVELRKIIAKMKGYSLEFGGGAFGGCVQCLQPTGRKRIGRTTEEAENGFQAR